VFVIDVEAARAGQSLQSWGMMSVYWNGHETDTNEENLVLAFVLPVNAQKQLLLLRKEVAAV
jgi:hypothetical protein